MRTGLEIRELHLYMVKVEDWIDWIFSFMDNKKKEV
jgi:hypothetical protein